MEDVEDGAGEAAFAKGGGEGFLVEEVAAAEVAEEGAGAEEGEAAGVEEELGLRPGREEAEDVVGAGEEGVEAGGVGDEVAGAEPVRGGMEGAGVSWRG